MARTSHPCGPAWLPIPTRVFLALILVSGFGPIATLAQDRKAQEPPSPEGMSPALQKRVDKAIDDGAAYLLEQVVKTHGQPDPKGRTFWRCREDELVLYTLIHAGVKADHPDFERFLDHVVKKPLGRTYNTACLAMALGLLNPAKYQSKLAEIAQVLVNSQNDNGQWGYSGTGKPPAKPTGTATKGAATWSKKGKRLRRIVIRRKGKTGGTRGDNSNTQYALLGLRACMEANIEIPKDILRRTVKHFERSLIDSKSRPGRDSKGDWVPSGVTHGIGGWGYDPEYRSRKVKGKTIKPKKPKPTPLMIKGSMTTAGIACLIISKHLLGQNWKKNKFVSKGINWLAKNFKVDGNPPRHGGHWHYYYLYGLERVGVLWGARKLGEHDWYVEGAEYLLKNQMDDGGWEKPRMDRQGNPIKNVVAASNTCFAILFLKRATRPLVATGPSKPAPKK